MADSFSGKQKKAYDLGHRFEKEWGDCSQATIRSLMEVYGETDGAMFKGMAGFHGGGGGASATRPAARTAPACTT